MVGGCVVTAIVSQTAPLASVRPFSQQSYREMIISDHEKHDFLCWNCSRAEKLLLAARCRGVHVNERCFKG